MKYLKQFENFTLESNDSFDRLRVKKNEAYFELIEILKGELFDDFDILPKKDEEFIDSAPHPTNPFWSYTVGTHNNYTAKQEEVGNKEIDRIVVFNILHKDYPEFKERLVKLKERAQDFIGIEIILNEESVKSHQIDYWDFIIKIEKIL